MDRKRRVKEVLEKGYKVKEGEKRRRWWDIKCDEEKRKIRAELRRWRRRKEDVQIYREAKERHKKLLEEKRKKENEKWMKEIGEIKTEVQVWKVVDRERRRRMVNEGISMEEWDRFFRKLLGAIEGRVVRGIRRRVRKDGKEDISRKEILGD